MNTKSFGLVKEMQGIIEKYDQRITVRQLYYQLVSAGLIENSRKSYGRMNYILTKARKDGLIDPFVLVDRSKPLLKQPSWSNLPDFVETVKQSYKRSVWDAQREYVEVWIEKDALSGVVKPITDKYDCYLAVGRGYQSFTNKVEAAGRFEGKHGTILYFGDFDPTGMDISRDVGVQLQELGSGVEVERLALNFEQVKDFGLPPMATKKSDSRSAAFVEKYGDLSVELDALPPNVLLGLVETGIRKHLDAEQYEKTIVLQEGEVEKLQEILQ